MIRGLKSLTLFSENARALAGFYRETVGLPLTVEAEVGQNGEELFGFEMSEGSGLFMMDHSGVKGRSKEPERMIFNIIVDDIETSVKLLDGRGVKKIQDTYHVEHYGSIATFEDPDGNYFQLVQLREG